MYLNNVNINWIWFLTHFSYTNFGAQLCLEFSQVDPLNLELYNHAKHISVVLTISPIKIWGKPVKGFIRYDETFPNIPTEISTLYIQHTYILIIIIQCFFTVRGAKLEKNLPNASALTHHTKSTKSLLVDTSLFLNTKNDECFCWISISCLVNIQNKCQPPLSNIKRMKKLPKLQNILKFSRLAWL